MIEYKVGTNARVPVRLLDSSGAPVTGIAFGLISATVEKADGSTVNMTPSGANWIEVTAGAFSSQGKYDLIIPSTMTNQSGVLVYAVTAPGALGFVGVVKLVTYEEEDTYIATVRALGLLHENSVLDQTVYNVDNKLTSGRLRLYNSKANAQAATGTGLLYTYSIVATYVGANVLTYTVVLE